MRSWQSVARSGKRGGRGAASEAATPGGARTNHTQHQSCSCHAEGFAHKHIVPVQAAVWQFKCDVRQSRCSGAQSVRVPAETRSRASCSRRNCPSREKPRTTACRKPGAAASSAPRRTVATARVRGRTAAPRCRASLRRSLSTSPVPRAAPGVERGRFRMRPSRPPAQCAVNYASRVRQSRVRLPPRMWLMPSDAKLPTQRRPRRGAHAARAPSSARTTTVPPSPAPSTHRDHPARRPRGNPPARDAPAAVPGREQACSARALRQCEEPLGPGGEWRGPAWLRSTSAAG